MTGESSKRSRSSGISARDLAYLALTETRIAVLPTARTDLLGNRFRVKAVDRALAHELVGGTIKRQATLDRVIEAYSGRGARRIEPALLQLLRLGTYQLLLLERVPDFAAVDETVELAKRRLSKSAAGFANAVLRNVQRGIVRKPVPLQEAAPASTVPITGHLGVLMDKALFADPQKDPAGYLAGAYSYPKLLIRRWLACRSIEQVRSIAAAGNCRPTMTVRPNVLKLKASEPAMARSKLLEALQDQGIESRPADDGRSVILETHAALSQIRAFRDGLFQVQDSTAGAPALQLDAQAGQVILDMCSGLGTKATQLAELTGDGAEIYACDSDPVKLVQLAKNRQRLGIGSVRPIRPEQLQTRVTEGLRFDRILLDVPCSNTGTLGRRAEARWRIKKDSFELLAHRQRQLLEQALAMLRSGGRLVYSTCSIDRQENEGVVAEAAKGSAYLVRQETTLPAGDSRTGRLIHDGGYWALLEVR